MHFSILFFVMIIMTYFEIILNKKGFEKDNRESFIFVAVD